MKCEEVDFLHFNLEGIATHRIPDFPLWAADTPAFLYDLAANKKDTKDPLVFKNQFLEIKEHYCLYEQINTDGSKDGKKSCCSCCA